MGVSGGQTQPTRETKPTMFMNIVRRMNSAVSGLEELIDELYNTPNKEISGKLAEAPRDTFAITWDAAPKMLEEQIQRLRDATTRLRELIL
jgi:hypothetical protein